MGFKLPTALCLCHDKQASSVSFRARGSFLPNSLLAERSALTGVWLCNEPQFQLLPLLSAEDLISSLNTDSATEAAELLPLTLLSQILPQGIVGPNHVIAPQVFPSLFLDPWDTILFLLANSTMH